MSSDNEGLPVFSGQQMGLLIGAALGMVLLLILCRYCINILVIDIFILGNYESLTCLCPCFRYCQRNHEHEQENEQGDLEHGLNARGMLNLQSVGALGNPVAFIYQLPHDKRKKFLEVIFTELFESSNSNSTTKPNNANGTRKEEPSETLKEGNKQDTEEGGGMSCSICLENLVPDEHYVTTKACSHTFHKDCIKPWLERSLDCPLCRTQMIKQHRLLQLLSKYKKMFK